MEEAAARTRAGGVIAILSNVMKRQALGAREPVVPPVRPGPGGQPGRVRAGDRGRRYATWREIYRRMLDITDDGLLNPLWRAAGA